MPSPPPFWDADTDGVRKEQLFALLQEANKAGHPLPLGEIASRMGISRQTVEKGMARFVGELPERPVPPSKVEKVRPIARAPGHRDAIPGRTLKDAAELAAEMRVRLSK